jgi:hypothetical protein
MQTVSRNQKLSVAKKGTVTTHIVRNEIALCVMVGGNTWMMSKYYPIASAPVMITKHIN